MNKTVNINLGGIFFYIDEDAFQKLTRYLEAIKRSLSHTNGKEEVMKDIEIRIAELINEKHSSEKQVVTILELDEIIAIMGQPEDYIIDTDEEPTKAIPNFSAVKKLYRDKDKSIIGGVASGLGHYFGIDLVWIRIAFLILLFGFGTGVLAYLILWIAIPEAVTTAEKLEMTGEAVTISSIEKKVREEFEAVSDKIKNVYYDGLGNKVKSNSEKLAGTLSDIITRIFIIFTKVLGILLIFWGCSGLVFFLFCATTFGTVTFCDFPLHEFVNSGNFTEYPIWVLSVVFFLGTGIPLFFLLLLGFKLVSPKIKSIGNIAKYTLLGIWIIAISLLISIGINQATAFSNEGREVQKALLPIQEKDTLQISFVHNPYFTKNTDDTHHFIISEDATNTKVIFSNEIRISIEKTNEKQPYLLIEKSAKGGSISEAKKTAEKINYGFKSIGNQLILDNYLVTNYINKYRNQEVSLVLYLPVGTVFKPDSSMEDYDESENSFFNMHCSSDNYIYKVFDSQVKCLNCPSSENEYQDVSPDSSDINIKINDKEIKFKVRHS